MTVRWAAVFLIMAIGQAGGAQSLSQRRFVLTAQQVSEALTHRLADRGIKINADEVSLAAKVVATEDNPVLDILADDPMAEQMSEGRMEDRSRVKLSCHVAATCLPFYAIVRWPTGMDKSADHALNVPSLVERTVPKTVPAITMRAGAHATLMMDDDRAQIQVSVISLESGSVGHRIHVASPDHKQLYVAEIVSATVLKGSF